MTHVPLWLPFPAFVTPIYLGDAQHPGALNLQDLAPEWVPHHPVLGGTAGAFALKNLVLRDHPLARRVGICQYRKFVSRRRISRAADRGYPVMDLVAKDQLGTTAQFAQHMAPGDEDFLLGRPMRLPWKRRDMDMLEQSGRVHHVADLLRFAAAAADLGVLPGQHASLFLHEKLFFPGGVELGVFPAAFWIESITAIEAVVRECVQRHPEPREGYQARAWSFCTERLGSYLLLKHLRETGAARDWARHLRWTELNLWARRYVGQMNLITEREGMNYVPGR